MVKLTDFTSIERLGEYPTQSLLDSALALARDGWHVFPLAPGKKIPLIGKKAGGNGCLDGTIDQNQIRSWWRKHPNAGIGANLGDNRLAIDLDFNHGASRLASLPDTRTHHSGRGNGNVHLIYRYESGSLASTLQLGANVLGPGIDLRIGRGGYIVMPPTPHEDTGKPYTLDQIYTREHTLTDEEVVAIWAEAGVELPSRSKALATQGKGKKSHKRPMESSNTTLLGLKADPPTEGGRNDWLAKVCGHLAKAHHGKEDLYRSWVSDYAALLVPPLSPEEIEKTADSIWQKEHADHPERKLMAENGYLSGNRSKLFCQIARKEGDIVVYDTEPYADFDIEAKGVAVDDTSRRVYWVRLYWKGKVIETTIPGEVMGSDQIFRAWLASRGLSVDPPFLAFPKTAPATRVLRYLNSQEPPEVSIVTTLGWDEKSGSFVTHEGVITGYGPQAKEVAGVVANPGLVERDVAPFVYGFQRNPEEASRVLAEVLTFQEEETASVFGAWWAAALLKPQIQQRMSIFPFFGIEAASESGKTNGFFDLMVALNGNTQGQVVPTKPVLRDLASANKSGIVWADDLNDLEPYGEMLRASTSNGTASKMDADRSGIKNTQIVAPILISGEALGFESQKALVDRSVVLQIESPKGRKSRHGDYPQWDDIVKLKLEYPASGGGLSGLSGWYVQHAMANESRVLQALRGMARKATGRHGDKLAVLMAGAMLLDSLVGHPGAWEGEGEHYRRVAGWCSQREQVLDQDNALTIKILPWALRMWDYPDEPTITEHGKFAGIRTPAYIVGDPESNETLDGGGGVTVFFHPKLLAEAWAREVGSRVDARTETSVALTQQANALGKATARANRKTAGIQIAYRGLPTEYVRVVLDRAR